MERVVSDEEKIRRAIEISQRRNNNYYRTESARVNVSDKKDYKLFKKMILQIIICLLIYAIFYLISSTNYIFSEQVIKSTDEILSYDINFQEIYNNFMTFINSVTSENQPASEENQILQTNNIVYTMQVNNETIIENNVENNVINNTTEKDKQEEENESKKEISKEKTQMELDAEKVKELCKFKKPLSGTVTSEFGEREVLFDGMTSDHKGIDIAAKSGTTIKAAMAGTVSAAEENSEYGKFIKITNGDVMTVYAHCKKLKVKVGDKIKIRTNNSYCWVNRKFNRSTFTF